MSLVFQWQNYLGPLKMFPPFVEWHILNYVHSYMIHSMTSANEQVARTSCQYLVSDDEGRRHLELPVQQLEFVLKPLEVFVNVHLC